MKSKTSTFLFSFIKGWSFYLGIYESVWILPIHIQSINHSMFYSKLTSIHFMLMMWYRWWTPIMCGWSCIMSSIRVHALDENFKWCRECRDVETWRDTSIHPFFCILPYTITFHNLLLSLLATHLFQYTSTRTTVMFHVITRDRKLCDEWIRDGVETSSYQY